EFPCSNCAAIEATLWLRPDGRFFLRQRFTDDAESSNGTKPRAPAATYGLGRWVWDDIAAELVLHGGGPERRLVVSDSEHLARRRRRRSSCCAIATSPPSATASRSTARAP